MKFPLARIRRALARVGDEARAARQTCAEMVDVARHFLRDRRLSTPDPEEPAIVDVSRAPARVPEGVRVYAVGDIHGRADLLLKLLKQIEADALGGDFRGKPVLVFLGDYVDRGMQSKDVIDILISKRLSQFETHFLKGNHESAMLQFLTEPAIGPRWAEYGGVETMASYGVRPPRARTAIAEWAAASDAMRKVLPASHLHFLRSLELSVRIGDYMFVHAGVKPGVDLEAQSEQDLLWIREEFLNDTRQLDAVIVHGHTPAPQPHKDSRRVGLDTGAYLSGRLTAARFEHDSVEFISTGAGIETARRFARPQEAKG